MLLFAIALLPAAYPQGTPSDDRLYDEVMRKLANDRDAGGDPIQITVKDGKVTLSGTVKSEKARAKAEKVARKVKGVTAVENRLTLRTVPAK
jgi:osmotically-inducible protein OsmY